MKQCTKCGEEKELFRFNRRAKGKDGYSVWCKDCFAAYDRARYRTVDKKRKDANAKARRDSNRAFIWQYLTEHPCVDCGESDPVVLEFDHVEGHVKDANISTLMSESGLKRIKAEIAKCEVRCANCHKRITYERAGSWRVMRNVDGS